jgi:hypothetical protein
MGVALEGGKDEHAHISIAQVLPLRSLLLEHMCEHMPQIDLPECLHLALLRVDDRGVGVAGDSLIDQFIDIDLLLRAGAGQDQEGALLGQLELGARGLGGDRGRGWGQGEVRDLEGLGRGLELGLELGLGAKEGGFVGWGWQQV